jgi:NADH-quinone oxidoreductase subunit J
LSIIVGIILVALAIKYPGPALKAPVPPHFGSLQSIGGLLWGKDFIYLVAIAIMLLSAALGVLVLNPPLRERNRMPKQSDLAESSVPSQAVPDSLPKPSEKEGQGA